MYCIVLREPLLGHFYWNYSIIVFDYINLVHGKFVSKHLTNPLPSPLRTENNTKKKPKQTF